MNGLTEAFLKFNLEITNKKGSEIPADVLSHNAVEAVGPFDDNWTTAHQEDVCMYVCIYLLKSLKLEETF